jgi:hypothetical protein
VLPTLDDAIRVAIGCLGLADVDTARVIRIRSTNELETVEVSPPVWAELQSR